MMKCGKGTATFPLLQIKKLPSNRGILSNSSFNSLWVRLSGICKMMIPEKR